MKKKTILLSALCLLSAPLFAQGASEIITGIGQGIATGGAGGAGLGAGIGSFFGPAGTLLGGAIGAGALSLIGGISGIFTGAKQAGINKEKRKTEFLSSYHSALGNLNQLEAQKAQQQIQITQLESNKSAFDQSLSRWQTQLDIEQQQSQSQATNQYNSLLQNWQGAELVNAVKGQTGGSAALVAEQSKQQLVSFVGSDLKLDLTGGTYGQSMGEFQMDLLAGRSQLIGQSKITQQALDIRRKALTGLDPQITDAKEILRRAKTKAGL